MSAVINSLKLLPLVAVVTGIFLCTPVFADENDFRCFKSIGLKNPVRLQFTFQSEKDDLGYVTYQRGSGRIQVKKISEKELRRVSGGRPSEFEMIWQEITPDGSGGRYVMLSQGAQLYDFRYIRKKDGKVLKFKEDPGALTEKGCDWINISVDENKSGKTREAVITFKTADGKGTATTKVVQTR